MSRDQGPKASELNCDQAREMISQAMDGELEGAKLALMKCHLSRCEDCTEHARQLAHLHDRLAEHLSDDRDTGEVWERVLTSIDMEAVGETQTAAEKQQTRRFYLRSGLAASLLAAAAGFGFYRLANEQPSDVLAETVNDFLTFRASGKTLHILGSDEVAVADWLEERVDFEIALRTDTPAQLSLSGGRLCSFLGRRLAFLHFSRGGKDAALYVMSDEGLKLPTQTRRSVEDRDFTTTTVRGVSSAIWRNAGLIYVVVSNLDEDELMRFVAEI